MSVKGKSFVVACVLSFVCATAGAAVIQISGGGLNLISDAVDGAANGDTIEITDSAVYTQDLVNWTIGKEDITIMASPGQSPEINFEQASEQAIIPNVAGVFQMGSNDGGRITLRNKVGVELFNGWWMQDGAGATFENLLITDQGDGGPYSGSSLWFATDVGETVTYIVDNVWFIDYHPGGGGHAIRVHNEGLDTSINSATVSNCVFINFAAGLWTAGGQTTVTNCLFQDWNGGNGAINAGLGQWAQAEAQDTLDISNCAFYMSETNGESPGNIGVRLASQKAPTSVTVDHCDFFGVAGTLEGGGVMNYADGANGAGNCTITNSNITTGGDSLVDNGDAPGTLTQDYNNMNGAATGDWTGGANNVSPFIAPDYGGVPDNWTYADGDLLVADSGGGAVGSSFIRAHEPTDIEVCGGGTNVLSDAVAGAGNGDTIVICDSLVYTETTVNWVIGKQDITIMAALGQTPSINFEQPSEQALIPNVSGFQLGSNAGGRITVRHKTGVELFNGHWMPDGSSVSFENLLITDQGAGGPYLGSTLFFIAGADETIHVTVDNVWFDWFHGAGNMRFMNTGTTGALISTVTDCVFTNSDTGIFAAGGNTTVTNCLFNNWHDFAIQAAVGIWEASDGLDTLDISNCAFYTSELSAYGAGSVGVFMGDSVAGSTITIDHCDFLSDIGGVFEAGAVQNVWSGAGDCSVTNSNISLPAGSLLDGSDTPSTLWQNYNNMNGSASGGWTGGWKNVSPYIEPNYADVPNDWRYTDATLLTSDSNGGAVGSSYPQGPAGPVLPVAGILGIIFLAGACATGGTVLLRKRG